MWDREMQQGTKREATWRGDCSGPGGGARHTLRSHAEVKVECSRQQAAGPGHIPLLGNTGGVLSAPRLKPDGSIQTTKRGVLVRCAGVLSEGCPRGGGGVRLFITRGLGEVKSGFTFMCDSVGCF